MATHAATTAENHATHVEIVNLPPTTAHTETPAKTPRPAQKRRTTPPAIRTTRTQASAAVAATAIPLVRNQVLIFAGEPTKAQIRDRAYFLYLARNGGPGCAATDWIQAERELRQEAAGGLPRLGGG